MVQLRVFHHGNNGQIRSNLYYINDIIINLQLYSNNGDKSG